VSDVVPVYRFDDGAVIERVLSSAALQARLPAGFDQRKVRPWIWDRAFTSHRPEEEIGIEERVGIYILLLPGERIAHSLASVLSGPNLRKRGYIFEFNRLDEEEAQDGMFDRLSRSYWRPFIEDTIWMLDENHAYWGSFYVPFFIDDQVYARLAHPIDGLDKKMAAKHQELLKIEQEQRDHSEPDYFVEDIQSLEDQWVDLAMRWLFYAFADGMEGIVTTVPSREQYFENPGRWNTDTLPDTLLGYESGMPRVASLQFQLVGRRGTEEDPTLEMFKFTAMRGVEEDGEYGSEKSLVVWWIMSGEHGDCLLASGITPSQALRDAEDNHIAIDPDNIDEDNFLPSSRRDAWYAENYKAGTPTFDMECSIC